MIRLLDKKVSIFLQGSLVPSLVPAINFCVAVLESTKALTSLMGGKFSKKRRNNPKYNDSARLAAMTMFSVNEVEALYVLYKRLSSCIVDDGLIHKEEFQHALLGKNRKPNLFVDRVFNLFDLKRNGVIEFEEFVQSLSVFHPNTPKSDKISFVFKLYDLRHTGYIEREEVKEMLLAILKESDLILSEDVVEAIIEKTFTEADSKQDGRIDQDEWKMFVEKNPSLLKFMTLPYLKDVSAAFPSFLVHTEVPDSA